jgi:hypothetical protein
MNHNSIDTLTEAEQKVSINYDSFLEMYEVAFEKGAKKDDDFEGEPLSKDEIEDAIDMNPKLFQQLQELFDNSSAIKAFAGEAEEGEPNKKK